MTSLSRGGAVTTYTHDATGAQTGSSTGTAYAYDVRQRATSTKPGTSAAVSMKYTGTSAYERIAAGTRTFTTSALGITSQTDSSGTTHFLRGPDGRILGQRGPAGKTWYYLADHLGSTTALVDATGARVNSFGYGPYGEYTYGSDQSNQPKVNWRYAGAYRDAETVAGTGLYKTGIRYYDTASGRFTQPDPTGQDANPYLYAGADPVQNADPTGAIAPLFVGIAVGAGLRAALPAIVRAVGPRLAASRSAGEASKLFGNRASVEPEYLTPPERRARGWDGQ